MTPEQAFQEGYLLEFNAIQKEQQKILESRLQALEKAASVALTKIAEEPPAPGFFQKGMEGLGAGFNQIGSGEAWNNAKDLFNKNINEGLNQQMARVNANLAQGAEKLIDPKNMSFMQKLRPRAGALWDTISHKSMRNPLAAGALGLAGVAGAGTGIYQLGKKVFGGGQPQQVNYYGH